MNVMELPFDFILKKVTKGKSGIHVSEDISELNNLWVDYQPNNLAWPLMSEKMKDIIIENLTGRESILWINARIKTKDESKTYYVPCFKEKLDVLDEQKTVFVPGTKHIIKPVFSLNKVVIYSLFHKPQDFWEITSGLYISESLKKAMQKEQITGVGFEKTSVS